MSDQTSESNSAFTSSSSGDVMFVIWCGALLFFLLAPFCLTKRQRVICRKRIRERRWNVYIEPEHDEVWYRLSVLRYERYRYVFRLPLNLRK
jgi:hypothetical protein